MGKNQRVLIDGGATHVLRKAKSQEEWDRGDLVQVALASGTTDLKQDAVTGSLLTLHDVQMIIPMAALTQLGYEVKWTGAGCSISAPDGAQLPVQLDQGCPTLPRQDGLRILQQVEALKTRETQLKLAALKMDVKWSGDCPEVTAVKRLTELFPELPADLVKEIPGYAEVDMNQVIFNRHQRRKVQRAKTLVWYIFSQAMIRSFGCHKKRLVLWWFVWSCPRVLIFEMGIFMDGLNNWQERDESTCSWQDHHAGQSVFADFDPWMEMMDPVYTSTKWT
eukprot:s2739_g9.t1